MTGGQGAPCAHTVGRWPARRPRGAACRTRGPAGAAQWGGQRRPVMTRPLSSFLDVRSRPLSPSAGGTVLAFDVNQSQAPPFSFRGILICLCAGEERL